MADVIQRPRVFVSSTIREFRDLREALKYWLEEMGFEVQLSEHNDFDREPDKGTYEACFDNIRSSAYYLLLIGGTKGSMYDESNNITVTRQEYRTAWQAREGLGTPKIVAVIRKQTMTALRERETAEIDNTKKSAFLDDPSLTRDFIREVRREDEVGEASTGDGEYPEANWLSVFATFRELTDLLRATLNIRGPLQQAAVIENLRHELERNLGLTMHQRKDGLPSYHHLLNTARDEVGINRDNYDGEILLTFEQVMRAHLYVLTGPPRPEVFVRRAVFEATLTGVLLDYDPAEGTFRPSELQRALYSLQDELDVYATRYEALGSEIRPAIFGLWDKVRKAKSGGALHGSVLTSLFALHDTEQNIVRITLGILRHLYRHTDGIDIQYRPLSPVEGEDERIQSERVSPEQLTEWLKEDNAFLRVGIKDETEEEQGITEDLWKEVEAVFGKEDADRLLSLLMSNIRETAKDAVRRALAGILRADPESEPRLRSILERRKKP